jgi:Histidine kinase
MTSNPPRLSMKAPHRYPRLRRFAIDVALTQLFNLAAALMVTYVLHLSDSLWTNLVVSVCIGTLMVTLIDGARLLLWGEGKPPLLPFLLLFAASLPVARYVGNLVAGLLLGIPPERIAEVRGEKGITFYVVFLLTCSGVTWFFWSRSRLQQLRAEAEAEKARAASIERQALQAQLQLLQAQIEPHMLFNTLANLQGLIAIDPPRAGQMLDQLIQYLRATLGASRARQSTVGQEFVLMQAYLGLMQVRMGSRLSCALHLPPELAALPVPPMLLQPLVENAIKHGLEPKLEGGRLEIDAAREGGELVLRVRDDGLGHDEQAPTAGTRTGISNIRERLQGLYGPRAALTLEPNSPHGLCAILRLPI